MYSRHETPAQRFQICDEPEFIRGVRFTKGELGVREVEKILKAAEKSE